MRPLKFLTDMAYSFGQSAAFFAFTRDLAENADEPARVLDRSEPAFSRQFATANCREPNQNLGQHLSRSF
jgi:hypothetical protein